MNSLKQLEDALTESIDLITEALEEVSTAQGRRLLGWATPLDAMRSEVRRMRGQIYGRLDAVQDDQ